MPKLKYLLTTLLTLNLTLTAFSSEEKKLEKFSGMEYIMGTLFKIELYAESKEIASKALKEAFKEIRRIDLVLSDYKDNSEIAEFSKNFKNEPLKISEDLLQVIDTSLAFSEATKGKFDITIQPLIKLWGFKDKNFKLPTKEEITLAKKSIGYSNIVLDKNNKTLFLKNPKLKIDFGAIGKGYAIDKAVEMLKKEGITSAFIDSVSNQYYLGTPPNKNFWKVGITHPRDKSKILKYLELKDISISTSGDYEQFFIHKNKRYTHIIDPLTGYPISEAIASTVISKNGAFADAVSTSVLLLDDETIKKLKTEFKATYILKITNKNNIIQQKEY